MAGQYTFWNTQEYFGEEKRESELNVDLGLITDGSNVVGETILFDALENEQSLDIQKGIRILP